MRGTLADEVRRRAADRGPTAGTAGLRERTEEMAAAAVATVGLPYTVALVERLRRHLDDRLAPAARQLGAYAATDIAAFPERLEKAVAALPRGRLQHGGQLHDQIRDLYEEQVYHHLNAQAALLVGQVLLDMAAPGPRPARGGAAGGAARPGGRARRPASPTPGWPGWPRTT